MNLKKYTAIGLTLALAFSVGCTNTNSENTTETNVEEMVEEVVVEAETPEVVEEEIYEEIDYSVVKPNELGEVMVVMYHSLGEKNSSYVRTVESFKGDLVRLNEMGFVSVSLSDYVNNNVDIPAGKTPVILTFDDGHKTNFNIIEENGEKTVDPNCTVGILETFYAENPEFGLEATFFLNGGTPFGQKGLSDYKVNYIVEKGMDIGNHSYGHENFKSLDSAGVEFTLGKNYKELKGRLPEYEINTLALPFGSRPPETERISLASGTYEDANYKHIAILNVGWKPDVSAANVNFNFESIYRVQSGDGDMQMTYWLDRYVTTPAYRYISDGNPNTIVFPERYAEKLNAESVGNKEVIQY